MIQFILNHSLVQLDAFQADTTLLDYLRLEADLKGSKEGCASGDCGACTVVIASPTEQGNKLEYQSLNSCICLLGSVHGKQVITVDGLKSTASLKNGDIIELSVLNNKTASSLKSIKKGGGVLHPVQQVMVDHHASQCGFCTPGFVMSLFSMSKNKRPVQRHQVLENIDGNLCRCTGYRPIIDAALDVLNQDFTDNFDKNSEATLKLLNNIQASESDSFLIPQSVSELATMIFENPDARLLAGGTDLAIDVTQGLQKLEKVIYLGQVKELKQITETDSQIKIGAALTYQECAFRLGQEYPALIEHLQRLGSTQIRNVGTLGGNVANASPIGDMPPVLMALDASLVLQQGENLRELKINDFYTGYKQTVMQEAEFLREIIIPKNRPDYQLKVYKITKRHADDISAICAAFYVHFKDHKIHSVRIAMGGMAATVKRAENCEKILINQKLDRKTLDKAKAAVLSDFDPLSDVRASREYRLLMAQNLLQRLFIDLGAQLND